MVRIYNPKFVPFSPFKCCNQTNIIDFAEVYLIEIAYANISDSSLMSILQQFV